ncbi:MAG TPA: tripartite tricarboxylate transporter substrate-binding protein, partial [Aestuariivirgaceae bacterium]|nr:tripartite tricarboxylate transporter substrate-binding protein [Aestuariivirgaceae bacterium]
MRCFAAMLPVAAMVAGAGVVSGQDYPNKTIRIYTAAAGGGSDFNARQMAIALGNLGQPVVVENRATGALGAQAAFQQPHDGYALNISGSALWTFTILYPASYDAVKDFSPITQIVREISILAVHPSVPVKSVKELIALAKSRPGELNYASTGIGGPQQLGTELFKSMAGVNIVHVPYKGTAPSVAAVMGGEAQLTINDIGIIMPQDKAGKLRALAVTSANQTVLAPGLVTVSESGLPGYELTGLTALFAPGRPPAAIISRLHQEAVRHLNRADVKELYLKTGLEVVGNTTEEFAAFIKTDLAKW